MPGGASTNRVAGATGRIYRFAKCFTLLFLLGLYLIVLTMFLCALRSRGYVVIYVDEYREGFAETMLLLALLPMVAYVVAREVLASIRAR